MQPIWLIGMMGSGKSTVGRLVAERLGSTHIDVDEEIARRVGCSIGELWGSAGEEAFRDMESAQIARLAGQADLVVSTGGGAVLRGENIRAMRGSGVVVWMHAGIPTLAERVGGGEERPLLAGEAPPVDRLTSIAAEREDRYRSAAHFTLDAERGPEEIATRVAGHARVTIGEDSEILIGRRLADRLLPERDGRTRAAVITQPGAAPVAEQVAAVIEAAGVEVESVELADREEAKDLTQIGMVYERLAAFNLGRHDTIVGVGGGTVTDAAGFVAATWLRGVESVMVPTTLLGAVDAAVGGKTGINVGGKNLVGAFWHPAMVVISLDVLGASPPELLVEGSAEALKAGFIADPVILEAYERAGADAPLEVVVPRAVAVKAKVVAADFRESDRRAILNFGHTLGHGIEVVAGLPHGHAVAVGMVAAAEVSRARYGFDAARLTGAVSRLGLPTAAPGLEREAVLELVALDKKRTSAGIRMVLLRDIADPVVDTVTEAELHAALAAVGIG